MNNPVQFDDREKQMLRAALPPIPVDRRRIEATIREAMRRRRSRERLLCAARVLVVGLLAIGVVLMVMLAVHIGRWLVGR